MDVQPLPNPSLSPCSSPILFYLSVLHSAASFTNTNPTNPTCLSETVSQRDQEAAEKWVNWTASNWSVLVPLLPQTVFSGNRKMGVSGGSDAVDGPKTLKSRTCQKLGHSITIKEPAGPYTTLCQSLKDLKSEKTEINVIFFTLLNVARSLRVPVI